MVKRELVIMDNCRQHSSVEYPPLGGKKNAHISFANYWVHNYQTEEARKDLAERIQKRQ